MCRCRLAKAVSMRSQNRACIACSFCLSLGRTHQKERLAPIRSGADLGFDPVAHLPPVPPIGKRAGELLQLALARADQIVPLAAPQPGDGLSARHATIHHPYAARLTI